MHASGLTPRWSSPPGDTISSALRDRGMNSTELIDLLGLSLQEVTDLLEGRLSITISLARSLERAFGGSTDFWIARDAQYLDDCARVSADHWSSNFPIKQMVDFGWIARPANWQERIETFLKFFSIEDVRTFDERYGRLVNRAQYRISPAFAVDTAAAAAWFRACERAADRIEKLADYNQEEFSRVLSEVRDLTRIKQPEIFVPKLIALCASCGVSVTLVRAPDGFPASGAARLYRGRPLIQLSARYLSDDHLWFTFFHEAGHVLLHSLDSPFVDIEESVEGENGENLEREANDFAFERLMGKLELQAGPISHRDVLRIAHDLRVSPGIIVGQLQHAGRIPRGHFNKLKRRYIWQGVSLGTAQRS